MYTTGTLKFLYNTILDHPNNAFDTSASRQKSTYKTLTTVTCTATLTLGVLFLLSPEKVKGFWPFTFAFAAEESETAVVHDPSIDLLEPALHSDPNPNKGSIAIAITEGSALIANGGPEGTLADIESRPAKGTITTYTVEDGDSLSGIASMFGVSTNTILWANDIKDAKTIKTGVTLLILPVSGVSHKVQKGETLASLAKKYDGNADDIAIYNGIESGSALVVGNTLIIPGGEVPKTVAKSTKTTTKKSTASKVLPAISGFFGNPLPGGRLTQGIHGYNGVDIGAPAGTPIYAAAGGSVIIAKGSGYNGGYGSYVVIDHGNGTQTLYAHMSSVAASLGGIDKGQLIGYVGSTGRSTGNHLHFEVRGAKNPFAK